MVKFRKNICLSFVIVSTVLCALLWGCGDPNKAEPAKKVCEKKSVKAVQQKIDDLAKSSEQIKSYQADIVSVFKQPLLEAQTVRKGMMYYARGNAGSVLRIDFFTRQDDDEEPEDDIQQFFFDGVWLSRVNFMTEHVEKRQMADESNPVDAINLVSDNFPLVGFSDAEELEKDFKIEHSDPCDSNSVGKMGEKIHLIPKKNSKYYDEYQFIDFWVDKKSKLPVRIESLTSEEDIYELSFLKTRVNENIDPNIFSLDVPDGFTFEVIKLENQ